MIPTPAALPVRPGFRRLRARHAGFTLIELLLVLGLLSLIATLFVGGAGDWLRAREQTPEDLFWKSVSEARQLALRNDAIVTMRYDPDKHCVRWNDGEDAHTVPWPEKGKLDFFQLTQDTGAILLGGVLQETGRTMAVHFYPDGSCDPFRAQVTDPQGHRRTLQIDPWTCAPILSARPQP